MASQPAPVVRPVGPARFTDIQPVQGVWVHAESTASVKTVSTTADATEIRVEGGRANVRVMHPAGNTELLVDLPGGQVSLLKDGLYTFNAQTNTVRVLRGEAEVFPANAKAIKVKEEHELSFAAGSGLKSVEVDPQRLTSDLLPMARPGYGDGYGAGYGEYGFGPYGYGYGPYGDGPYPYPYPVAYGWGYPYWGWGYPYGFGLGVGFYGGYGRVIRR